MSGGYPQAKRAGLIERWLVGVALALAALVGQVAGPIVHGFGLESAAGCEAPASPPDGASAPRAERAAPGDPERSHHDPSECAACHAFAAVRVWTCTGADAGVAKADLDCFSTPETLSGQARVASLWRANSRGPPVCATIA